VRYLKLGLTEHDEARATPGFTLYSPLLQSTSYLINMLGDVVHQWDLPAQPGNYAYLLANGNLFVATKTDVGPVDLNAKGGLIQEIDWDGNVVWEYRDDCQHHDFCRTRNGNLIYLGWEVLPGDHQARVKGGQPGSEHEAGIWGDYIREVDSAGETVWEWHGYDHMDFDIPLGPNSRRAEYAHPNAISETLDGDILVSWRHIDMCAIIDRVSGDFKWMETNKAWGGQHDVQMLDNGNLMLFANTTARRGPGAASQVIEFNHQTGETVWQYRGDPAYTFHSPHISGCQRLASGNTLICEGLWGRIFEVTPLGDVVWEYISPYFVQSTRNAPDRNSNSVFRAYRYASDGPEIQGRLGSAA